VLLRARLRAPPPGQTRRLRRLRRLQRLRRLRRRRRRLRRRWPRAAGKGGGAGGEEARQEGRRSGARAGGAGAACSVGGEGRRATRTARCLVQPCHDGQGRSAEVAHHRRRYVEPPRIGCFVPEVEVGDAYSSTHPPTSSKHTQSGRWCALRLDLKETRQAQAPSPTFTRAISQR
jgi:hypothetical protein